MKPLEIQVINWKKQIGVLTLIASVHPFGYLLMDLYESKPVELAFVKFGLSYCLIFVIDLLWALSWLFSNKIFKLVADEDGLLLKSPRHSRRIHWTQIGTMERSIQNDNKTAKNCLILRDAGGQTLAMIFREVVESPSLKAQYEQLEAFISSKIGTRGVIAPALEAPLSKTQFVLQTKNKMIGLLGLAFFLPCAFLSWGAKTGGPGTSAIFLFFVALGIVLLLSDSKYEVDERSVRAHNLFKKSELRWEEIDRVEMMRNGISIRFSGNNSAVDVLGPVSWSNDGAALMQFLHRQIEKLNLAWDGDRTIRRSDFSIKAKRP